MKNWLWYLLGLIGIRRPLPKVKSQMKIYSDTRKVLKVNSIQKASCGLLICTYNNDTRCDSWVSLLNDRFSVIIATRNETMGTPSKVGNQWIFPMESKKKEQLFLVNDKTAEVTRGVKALDEYATISIDGYIPYANPVRICDTTGKIVNAINGVNGIVSGMIKNKDEIIVSIMDGSAPGIASTKGWSLSGSYPDVCMLDNKIYGFSRYGEVHEIEKGKIKKTIVNTKAKAQRTRIHNNLIFWTTANPDELWVSNGKDCKRLCSFPDGDKPNGTSSGSLFNTSVTFDGNNVIVARSVDNLGYEVWKITLE